MQDISNSIIFFNNCKNLTLFFPYTDLFNFANQSLFLIVKKCKRLQPCNAFTTIVKY